MEIGHKRAADAYGFHLTNCTGLFVIQLVLADVKRNRFENLCKQ